jgi:hypothetical protein
MSLFERVLFRNSPHPLSLPNRKLGLPNLRNILRNQGKPGFRRGREGWGLRDI